MDEKLRDYAELMIERDKLNDRIAEIEGEIRAHVESGKGELSAYGFKARMKPGRNKTDHKAAAAGVDSSIVEKFTTIKTTSFVAWAKVTKAAGISKDVIAEHTTTGDPVFVIEVLK